MNILPNFFLNSCPIDSWLSVSEVKELEVPLRTLLTQLMVRSSEDQLLSFFVMIRDGLVASHIEAGYHKVS